MLLWIRTWVLSPFITWQGARPWILTLYCALLYNRVCLCWLCWLWSRLESQTKGKPLSPSHREIWGPRMLLEKREQHQTPAVGGYGGVCGPQYNVTPRSLWRAKNSCRGFYPCISAPANLWGICCNGSTFFCYSPCTSWGRFYQSVLLYAFRLKGVVWTHTEDKLEHGK